jgi:hypothetical protein
LFSLPTASHTKKPKVKPQKPKAQKNPSSYLMGLLKQQTGWSHGEERDIATGEIHFLPL